MIRQLRPARRRSSRRSWSPEPQADASSWVQERKNKHTHTKKKDGQIWRIEIKGLVGLRVLDDMLALPCLQRLEGLLRVLHRRLDDTLGVHNRRLDGLIGVLLRCLDDTLGVLHRRRDGLLGVLLRCLEDTLGVLHHRRPQSSP